MLETRTDQRSITYWLSCDTPECNNGWRMELTRSRPSYVRRQAGKRGWRTLEDEDMKELLDVCPFCVQRLLEEKDEPVRLYDFDD
jgi:hypothetical protein